MVPRMRRAAPPPQPHDAIFKWTFSKREHAAGLLRAALPAAWVIAADFRTLRLENRSFISRALRSRHSDLVFSIRMRGQKVYFYILVEQQREVQALMIVRLGIYMMRLYEELLRDHPNLKEIPPILPLLVHHSDTGWTAATAFQDVIALDDALRAELRPYLPHFAMRLIDLHEEQATNLVTEMLTSLGQVVMFALSVAGDDARLQRELGRVGAALDDVLRAPDAHAVLEVLLRYLAATHRRLHAEKINELLENAAGPEAREVIVTFVEQIELKGRKMGRAEGGALVLLAQLEARFGPVPAEARAKVEAADEAMLARWAVRVLTAPSLEDTLAGNGKARPRKPGATGRVRRS